MVMRAAIVSTLLFTWMCVGAAVPALSQELAPDQARAFMIDKVFDFTCSDGTAGIGRILADGSVVGTIRIGSFGQQRSGELPPGTIRADRAGMCAHLDGLPITPCFKVQTSDHKDFRGSITGLGLAHCDLSQHDPRARLISDMRAPRAAR